MPLEMLDQKSRTVSIKSNYSTVDEGFDFKSLYCCSMEVLFAAFDRGMASHLGRVGLPSTTTASLHAMNDNFAASFRANELCDFETLATAVLAASSEIAPLSAFTITAPHTHWLSDRPTIVSEYNQGYVIGPLQRCDGGLCRAVSFVIHSGQAIPYEWVDDTVEIDENQLKVCHRILSGLSLPAHNSLTCGVAINFRFKQIFETTAFSTIENPTTDYPDRFEEASYIEPMNAFDTTGSLSTENVGWPLQDLSDFAIQAVCERNLARYLQCNEDIFPSERTYKS